MKKTYIAPCSITIEAEVEQVLNVSPRIKKDGFYMQYDGDPLHNDLSIHGGKMAGPASEYIGTNNDQNPVDEDDIFN